MGREGHCTVPRLLPWVDRDRLGVALSTESEVLCYTGELDLSFL